jgi:hypothetical protein
MLNMMARTEISDAWANIVLAESQLKGGKFPEAHTAIVDAERHFKNAKSAVEAPGPILDKLADLRNKLNQLQSIISRTR